MNPRRNTINSITIVWTDGDKICLKHEPHSHSGEYEQLHIENQITTLQGLLLDITDEIKLLMGDLKHLKRSD